MDAINSPEYGSLTIGATAVRHSDFGDITFTLVESWGGMKWTEGYGSTPLYWMGEDIRTEPTRWTLTQGTGEGLTIGECIARDDARRRRQAKADREATMKRYGRVPWWA